jgi:hypothetical protein
LDLVPNFNGVHEVHNQDCKRLPVYFYSHFLGIFDNDDDALRKADEISSRAAVCHRCCFGNKNDV